MSWKNIKTFLIVLFLIINIYLIYSQYGFSFKSSDSSYVSKDTLSDSIWIIEKNYNIDSLRVKLIDKMQKRFLEYIKDNLNNELSNNKNKK